MFTLTIETDNGVFTVDGVAAEVSRILAVVAHRVLDGCTSGKLRDINGNVVGSFKFEE